MTLVRPASNWERAIARVRLKQVQSSSWQSTPNRALPYWRLVARPPCPVPCLPSRRRRVDFKVLGLNVIVDRSQSGGSWMPHGSPPVRWRSQCSGDDMVMVFLLGWPSQVAEDLQPRAFYPFRDWRTARDASNCSGMHGLHGEGWGLCYRAQIPLVIEVHGAVQPRTRPHTTLPRLSGTDCRYTFIQSCRLTVLKSRWSLSSSPLTAPNWYASRHYDFRVTGHQPLRWCAPL